MRIWQTRDMRSEVRLPATGADEMLSRALPDEGILVCPFFRANECGINTADKKPVPFQELLGVNYQNSLPLGGS